jgi:hypothetical protein
MARPEIGRELLNVPMGDMIRDMAFAIAEAQIKLDSNSVEVAQMMGGLKQIEGINGSVAFEDSRVFFGKEKMYLSSAADIYNSTTDAGLKATLWNNVIADAVSSGKLIEFMADGRPVVHTGLPVLDNTTDTDVPNKRNVNYIYREQGLGADFLEWDTSLSPDNYSVLSPPPSDFKFMLKAGQPDISVFVPARVSMLELGFTPTFYQFVDTIIEVKISITYSEESSSTVNTRAFSAANSASGKFGLFKGGAQAERKRSVTAASVNATYSNKYSYTAEGSSLLRTKLTPVPPPAILEERIRQLMEILRETETNPPTNP